MLNDEQRGWLAEIDALIARADWAGAKARIEEVQQRMEGPWATRIFIQKGIVLQALGNARGADQSFMTAYSVLKYGPEDDPELQGILGRACAELGLADEARAAYQRVLAVRPDDEAARAGLARLGS
ncbi:MAG: tetratricopeptide repeat protein [Myxococcota bacterium]|jgi:Flp pilus assembly protein TadD|nr:tetratricopeptide repeat protein [Myxococcota bacterium]